MNCFQFQEDPNHGLYSVSSKIMREVNQRKHKRKAGSDRDNDNKRNKRNEDANGNKDKSNKGPKDNKKYGKYGPGLLGNLGSDNLQEHPK